MPQFEISVYYSQIFWLIIVFSFLYIIVARFISPLAEQIFKRRRILISDMLNDADTLTTETESLKTKYNMLLKDIINDADNIKKESLDLLNASFNRKKQILKNELDSKRQESLEEIQKLEESFVEEQQASCMDLASFIIEKISGKKPELKLLKACYGKIK